MITLTGHGSLAEAYQKVNPDVRIASFRKLNDADMQKVIKESDCIIHNAANTWSDETQDLIDDNLNLTRRITYNILKTKLEVKFINIGSMSYLHPEGFLSIGKMSPYAYSKFLAEMHVLMTIPNKKLVRFSTIFYKDHTKDGLSKLIFEAVKLKKFTLINSGKDLRDWIPINIAAKYLAYVIENKTNTIINICSGRETSFFTAGKMITKLTGVSPGFKNLEVPKVMSKFTLALPEIRFDLEQEIKDYISKI